ncbi:MAG: ATP-binding cassette, subfamily bacterial [Actinomycetota bacterium]|jgi:ATP-binding cassette subfamily B protein|nr:ATP-binding cassette, subfamily bacterial [Actinomycetota bacterium]
MMGRSRAPVGPDGQAAKPKDARGTLRRIVVIFRPYRAQLALLAVTIVVTSGLGVVNPLLIKQVFDKALFGPNKMCSGVPCPNLPLLYRLVALGLAIPVVTSIIGVGQTFLSNSLGLRLMRDLRDRLYTHLQSLSMRFFTSTRTGEIQSRLTNDVAGVQSIVTDTASSILSNVVIITSSFVAMWVLSWKLTVMSLILVPLFVFFTYRVGKSRRALQSVAQQSLADLTAITEETLSVSGILLAKVFGRQRHEIARFTDENQRFTDIQLRQRMTGRYFFAVVGTFFSVTPFIVYLVAGLFQHSGLTPGLIVAFTTLQARLFFPIGQMLSISTDVQSSMALFERIFEYMDLPVEIADAPDARPLAPEDVRGEVAFRHVQFRYDDPVPPAQPAQEAAPEEDGAAEGPREWTLDGVDFDIQPGQLAALVGPSGAGKTTTTYLVPRLYDVQEGAVEIDGIDVRKITLESLGGLMGVVTQETYLFHTTVRRNLQQGKLDATQEELEAACKAAFIHDKIMELPEGYDTVVGERGYKLSGGEKQRLAIARVILKDPRILILDEATSSLDTTSERLVQEALRPLMRGRTTIAIAHRLSTILSADVIFVLERGRIVERGTHAELVRRGGLYAELYEQQFRGGLVEAECEDGLVLATGAIVPASNDHA